jgi:hypothetical protein
MRVEDGYVRCHVRLKSLASDRNQEFASDAQQNRMRSATTGRMHMKITKKRSTQSNRAEDGKREE